MTPVPMGMPGVGLPLEDVMANDLVPAGKLVSTPGRVAATALGGAVVAGVIAASFYLSALWLGLAVGAIGFGVLAAAGARRAV
jgi:hypothetical protein